MNDIVVRDLSKRYKVLREGRRLGVLPRREPLWALREVSFDVARGEAVGIVGANGSGKTTLVRVLSRITAPTEGEILLGGRLSGLVELGAGFHPDLTGYENIYLNGAILGMSRREISRKIDSIVEFSGMSAFLNVPVKKYSSGMHVRLGFAIAVHLDAEILLLDEVLAVGDVAFQARCFERIGQLREDGKTVVLVSHDLAAIERICDRAILLKAGRLEQVGTPRAIIEAYQSDAYAALPRPEAAGPSRKSVVATWLRFAGADGGPARTGEELTCRLGYAAHEPVEDVVFTVSLNWPSGYLCTQITSGEAVCLEPGEGEVDFRVPILTMQRGLYSVDVAVERGGEVLDSRPRCSLLRVDPGRIVAGDFLLEHTSRIRQHPKSQCDDAPVQTRLIPLDHERRS